MQVQQHRVLVPHCHSETRSLHTHSISMSQPSRHRVIALYKQLSYLGREYPAGSDFFHQKLKSAFLKNRDLKDPAEIQKRIDLGDYVCKEIEAMYHINKYRAMKKRYYEDHEAETLQQQLESKWASSEGASLKK